MAFLKQPIISGHYATSLNRTANRYIGFSYAPHQTMQASVADPHASGVDVIAPSSIFTLPGVLKEFRVHLQSDNLGAGASFTFNILKNNVATGATITISHGSQDGSDLVNEVTIAAGDLITIEGDPNSSPNPVSIIWTAVFETEHAKKSTHSGGYTGNLGGGAQDAGEGSGISDTDVNYGAPVGCAGWGATENRFIVCPMAGKIKDLFVVTNIAPGGSASYTFTIRKGGVDTDVEVVLTGSNRAGNNTTDEIEVAEGDLISVKVTPADNPNGGNFDTAVMNIGFTFEANTAGQFPVFSNTEIRRTSSTQQTPTDRVIAGCVHDPHAAISDGGTSTVEYSHAQLLSACTLKKMVARLSVAPGAGNSRQYTLRKNEADQSLDLTISGTDTTGDVTADVAFAANDIGYVRSVLVSSPDDTWESVSFMASTEFEEDNPETDEVSGTGFCDYVEDGQVRKMVDEVSGLDHLEGETIQVQMDGDIPRNASGKEVTNAFVVASGTITLPKKAAVVHAGLPYEGTLRFLPMGSGSSRGTGHSKMRRVFLSVLRLFRTLGLEVGIDEDHLEPIFASSRQVLYTGNQKKLPDTTWKEDAEVVIKQRKPLPAYITAAITRSEVEEKL